MAAHVMIKVWFIGASGGQSRGGGPRIRVEILDRWIHLHDHENAPGVAKLGAALDVARSSILATQVRGRNGAFLVCGP